MAGLRNILVHEYLRIDVERLIDFLKQRLGDFCSIHQVYSEIPEKHHCRSDCRQAAPLVPSLVILGSHLQMSIDKPEVSRVSPLGRMFKG